MLQLDAIYKAAHVLKEVVRRNDLIDVYKRQPTNHALRDIAALGKEFDEWGRGIVLLFPNEEQYKKFRPQESVSYTHLVAGVVCWIRFF